MRSYSGSNSYPANPQSLKKALDYNCCHYYRGRPPPPDDFSCSKISSASTCASSSAPSNSSNDLLPPSPLTSSCSAPILLSYKERERERDLLPSTAPSRNSPPSPPSSDSLVSEVEKLEIKDEGTEMEIEGNNKNFYPTSSASASSSSSSSPSTVSPPLVSLTEDDRKEEKSPRAQKRRSRRSRKGAIKCFSDCPCTFDQLSPYLKHLCERHKVKIIRAPFSYWLQWLLEIPRQNSHPDHEGEMEQDGESESESESSDDHGKRWSVVVMLEGKEGPSGGDSGCGECGGGGGGEGAREWKIFLFMIEQDVNEEGVPGDYHIQIWNLNREGSFMGVVRFAEGGFQGQWVWPLLPLQQTTRAILPKAATENLPLTTDNRRILKLNICIQPQKTVP
jgi:hypothetical protein